jgi:peptide/nickel transport system substrate-binding protein
MTLRSLLAVSLSGILGSACSGGGAGERGEDAAPTELKDTLVVGWQSDIGNLNPIVYETAADGMVLEQLSFPLVDSEFDCSLKKLPGIAKSWEWSDDGTVLKMELRDDIKWEDGKPVTPEDIAFTYELVGDNTVASPRIESVDRMTPDGRPKIVDATHIEWHFTRAYDRDTQMSHTGLALLPKHVFADADRATLRGNEHSNRPLSYGPWRLAKHEPNQRIILEPNPNFSGPEGFKPRLNRVIFRVIPEYATRLIELESGGIDLMENVLPADADRLRADHPELRLVRRGWRFNDYIAWNQKNPLFQDLRVRKALAMGANIDDMIAKLLTSKTGEKYARHSIGTITPALCGVHNEDVKPLPYDPAAAKKLLGEAGWRDSDGDGLVDNGGKKFEFTLNVNTGNKRRADVAVLLQANLKDIGVGVNIVPIESNTFFENLRKRDYEAALAGWSSALFVDPSTLWHCDTPDKQYAFNFTSYCNPEVDALIDQGLATPNPKDSAPIWKEVQAKIYADQPYLFLYWLDEIVAVHSRFQNTTIDILSTLNRLHEWEVPPDQVKYKR